MTKTCPRCDLGDFSRARRADGVKHKATVSRPEVEELQSALEDGACDATDGCQVEPDGTCTHGHSSWLLVFGLI